MTDRAVAPRPAATPIPTAAPAVTPTPTPVDPGPPAGAGIGALTVGAVFGEDGRYTLRRLIGAGGMASVWAADDARLGREVAVKVISDALALDPEFVERFEREARLAGALSHPHVAAVFDCGTHEGRPYLVMEHVTGGTLAAPLDGGARLDPTATARALLGALAYIHAAGVLHRDLKPANVLLGADGRLRLTDFGIAHLADATRLTRTGLVLGTARYSAPEVLAGRPADQRADLYSCGVVLRECAAAAPGRSSEPLRRLIESLTEADPDRRPASAAHALRLLDERAAPASPAAAPPPAVSLQTVSPQTRPMTASFAPAAADRSPAPPARAGEPARRKVALAAAAGIAAIAAVALTVGLATTGAEPVVPATGDDSVSQQLDRLDDAVDRARR